MLFHSIISHSDKGLKMKNDVNFPLQKKQKKPILSCRLESLTGTEIGRVILVVRCSFSILSARRLLVLWKEDVVTGQGPEPHMHSLDSYRSLS